MVQGHGMTQLSCICGRTEETDNILKHRCCVPCASRTACAYVCGAVHGAECRHIAFRREEQRARFDRSPFAEST